MTYYALICLFSLVRDALRTYRELYRMNKNWRMFNGHRGANPPSHGCSAGAGGSRNTRAGGPVSSSSRTGPPYAYPAENAGIRAGELIGWRAWVVIWLDEKADRYAMDVPDDQGKRIVIASFDDGKRWSSLSYVPLVPEILLKNEYLQRSHTLNYQIRLASLTNKTVWKPGQALEAGIQPLKYALNPPMDSVQNGYGVMAFKQRHDAIEIARDIISDGFASALYAVVGQVSLWGDVVEHERGYRAQFAQPKSFDNLVYYYVPLKMPPDRLMNCLRDMYGVRGSAND